MSSTNSARHSGASSRSSQGLSTNRRLIDITGRSFDEWFDALDNAGAEHWPHWKIKRYLGGKRETDEWWASAVADAYERARGGEAPHAGTFAAKATKTLHAPIEDVWPFVDDEDERRAWLDVELEKCASADDYVIRAELADSSRVTISLRPPASGEPESCHVTIRHSGLAKEDELEETKAFWRSALRRLATIIADERATE